MQLTGNYRAMEIAAYKRSVLTTQQETRVRRHTDKGSKGARGHRCVPCRGGRMPLWPLPPEANYAELPPRDSVG